VDVAARPRCAICFCYQIDASYQQLCHENVA